MAARAWCGGRHFSAAWCYAISEEHSWTCSHQLVDKCRAGHSSHVLSVKCQGPPPSGFRGTLRRWAGACPPCARRGLRPEPCRSVMGSRPWVPTSVEPRGSLRCPRDSLRGARSLTRVGPGQCSAQSPSPLLGAHGMGRGAGARPSPTAPRSVHATSPPDPWRADSCYTRLARGSGGKAEVAGAPSPHTPFCGRLT